MDVEDFPLSFEETVIGTPLTGLRVVILGSSSVGAGRGGC